MQDLATWGNWGEHNVVEQTTSEAGVPRECGDLRVWGLWPEQKLLRAGPLAGLRMPGHWDHRRVLSWGEPLALRVEGQGAVPNASPAPPTEAHPGSRPLLFPLPP